MMTTFSLATVILLLEVAGASPQATRFQESMSEGETALNQRRYEPAVTAFKNAVRETRAMAAAPSTDLAKAQANYGLSRAYLGLRGCGKLRLGCTPQARQK